MSTIDLIALPPAEKFLIRKKPPFFLFNIEIAKFGGLVDRYLGVNFYTVCPKILNKFNIITHYTKWLVPNPALLSKSGSATPRNRKTDYINKFDFLLCFNNLIYPHIRWKAMAFLSEIREVKYIWINWYIYHLFLPSRLTRNFNNKQARGNIYCVFSILCIIIIL